jgi:transglutaminase-like putative cysteine protease
MLEFLSNLFSSKPPAPISKTEIGRGNASIANTLRYMKKLVIDSDNDRVVKETAKNIIKSVDPRDHKRQVDVIVGWVRKNFRYVRDIYGVEELTSPQNILHAMEKGRNDYSSDCDDFAVLIAALLRSVGFRTRLEAVGVGSQYYNHARLSVAVDGAWLGIEGTKTTPVGYAQPSDIPIMSVEVL